MHATGAALQIAQQYARRRRVVVIPSEYPDLSAPLEFNGNWAEEQTRAVASRHDVAVVYPVLDPDHPNWIEERRYHGVPTMIVHYHHVRKTWLAPYVFAAWRGLRRVVSELEPECIHAHGLYPAGVAAVLLGRILRLPVVVTEHWGQLKFRTAASSAPWTTWQPTSGRYLANTVLKFAIRHATQVIAVSKFLAAEICALEPRCSVTVVPNVVAPIFFDTGRARLPHPRTTVELLFVGSLRDYRKGLDDLLRALRVYLDSPGALHCHLTVIGDGAKRTEFEELAMALGVWNRCNFLGNLSREEVAVAMAHCDLFVMPSKYETFGVVYAEAMACGKPIIACQNGPAEEIVPIWAGMLVPPSDQAALARAIHQVVSNLQNYDPSRISDHARQNFGSEAVVAAISCVYEQVIYGLRRCL